MTWKIVSALAVLILGACTYNESAGISCPSGYVPSSGLAPCEPENLYPECRGLDPYQEVECQTAAEDFRKPWTTNRNYEPAQNLYTCDVTKTYFTVELLRSDEFPTGLSIVHFSKGETYPGRDATLRINDQVFKGQEGRVPWSRELLNTMSSGGIGYWHTWAWPSGEYTGKVNFDGFADAYSKCYTWIAAQKP